MALFKHDRGTFNDRQGHTMTQRSHTTANRLVSRRLRVKSDTPVMFTLWNRSATQSF